MSVAIEQVTISTDGRGFVFEPLSPALLSGQRNVHVAVTQPGCVRGNHRHERGTELLTVCGPALVRIRVGDSVKNTVVQEGEVVRFTIPPGVAHAILNTGDRPMLLVGFNTVPHDPAQPDVVQEVLIEPRA